MSKANVSVFETNLNMSNSFNVHCLHIVNCMQQTQTTHCECDQQVLHNRMTSTALLKVIRCLDDITT